MCEKRQTFATDVYVFFARNCIFRKRDGWKDARGRREEERSAIIVYTRDGKGGATKRSEMLFRGGVAFRYTVQYGESVNNKLTHRIFANFRGDVGHQSRG